MALLFCSPDDVADLVPQYTASGEFTTSTTPSLSLVSRWLGEVSAIVRTIMTQNGITIPDQGDESDLAQALRLFVSSQVADLAHNVNNRGRFSRAGELENTQASSPVLVITREAGRFLESYAKDTGTSPESAETNAVVGLY